jgi:hypothetical protein
MKQDLSLENFAHKMEHSRFNKVDVIASTKQLGMELPRFSEEKGLKLEVIRSNEPNLRYEINNHAHGQIATKLKIPMKFYDRLRTDHPDTLADVVTTLFDREPENRMIRVLDGTARAYLSDKFRIDMDNWDVANAALPILQCVPDIQIKSLSVTDTRMYIKALFPRIKGSVGLNDPVQAGIVISNSEVGCGSLRVEPLIYRLSCLNGMISATMLKKFHVGARHGMSDETYAVLTQEARDKSAEAMRLIIRDVVKAATDAADFAMRVKELEIATQNKIEGDVPKAVEVLGNRLNLTHGEQSSVLRHLIEGGDLSQYGMANAVTRTASDLSDYDRVTELERFGGNVIDLVPSQWQEVALAA